MFVLIFACLVTPCRIAFVENETPTWIRINKMADLMFLFDILIIFNSAYYDEDF